jgi:ATP-binding cassette subfamily F protein 3
MWSLETEKLSGGQQNRLGLACLLLAAPDVLVARRTDKPSRCERGRVARRVSAGVRAAYVIISTIGTFSIALPRIIELENGRAASYTGNYSDYLVEREERREAQQRAYDNQQQLIAKTEEFIRRNLAGQKTKQAKSRRKMLEKLERIDAVRAISRRVTFVCRRSNAPAITC